MFGVSPMPGMVFDGGDVMAMPVAGVSLIAAAAAVAPKGGIAKALPEGEVAGDVAGDEASGIENAPGAAGLLFATKEGGMSMPAGGW